MTERIEMGRVKKEPKVNDLEREITKKRLV